MTKIQIKRGTEANRTAITPDVGEPIYATDSKKLYVGDGVTAGGVEVAKDKIAIGGDLGGTADNPLVVEATELVAGKIKLAQDFAGTAQAPRYNGRNGYTFGPSNADFKSGDNHVAALQAAMDSLSSQGGGIIYLQPYEYTATAPIIARDNITLVSMVRRKSIWTLAPASNCPILRTQSNTGVKNFSIQGIVFDGNGSNQTGRGVGNIGDNLVDFSSSAGSLDNLFIDDCEFRNSYKHMLFIHGDQTRKSIQLVQRCKVYNHGSDYALGGVIGFGLYADYNPTVIFAYNHVEKSNGNDSIEMGHLGCTAIGNFIYDGMIQFPFGDNSIIANNRIRQNVIQNDANSAKNVIIMGNQLPNATPANGYAAITVYGENAMVIGNYAKSTGQSVIRLYKGDGGVVMGNQLDGSAKVGKAVNGVYLDNTNGATAAFNNIKNVTNGITVTHNDNNIYMNNFQKLFNSATETYDTTVGTGISLSSSASSGNVITNCNIGFNNYAGADVAFDPTNQSNFSIISQKGKTTSIGAVTTNGRLDINVTNPASTDVPMVIDNYGSGRSVQGKMSGQNSWNITKDGQLGLGVNGWVYFNGSSGRGTMTTSTSVAHQLEMTHNGAIGNSLTVHRNGNDSNEVYGLAIDVANAGTGPATAAKFSGGPILMTNQNIKNVADPVAAQDAATKAYVDSAVSGASSSNSVAYAVRAITAARTLDNTDYTVFATAATAPYNVTLPTAVGITGRRYLIKKTDSSANAVTVVTTSSQTIDGAANYPLSTQWKRVELQSDGANWQVVGSN